MSKPIHSTTSGLAEASATPRVTGFFDPATFTYSYVVADQTGQAAVIDAVLDYDPAAGRTQTNSADTLIAYLRKQDLTLKWILETHVHADHLSAAQYVKHHCGGQVAIGAYVSEVQNIFAGVFNAEDSFATDGSQFDRLLNEGDELPLGDNTIEVIHTPGHTPACVTYVIGDTAFVGDTLFMPDYGTARTDFPGGNAGELYRSIEKILSLPEHTRLYMCHDYGTQERSEYANETTVAEQRTTNVHLKNSVSEAEFVEFRNKRDAELAAPKLLYPSVQFNMRGGAFPPAEANGKVYFKIPLRTHTC